jgi:ketosteroid isomerase-like protein
MAPGSFKNHDGRKPRRAAWDDYSMEPERWIDAGDAVVFVFQMTAKRKGSGVEVSRRDAMVWTLRNGSYYKSESQALEAVGLSDG